MWVLIHRTNFNNLIDKYIFIVNRLLLSRQLVEPTTPASTSPLHLSYPLPPTYLRLLLHPLPRLPRYRLLRGWWLLHCHHLRLNLAFQPQLRSFRYPLQIHLCIMPFCVYTRNWEILTVRYCLGCHSFTLVYEVIRNILLAMVCEDSFSKVSIIMLFVRVRSNCVLVWAYIKFYCRHCVEWQSETPLACSMSRATTSRMLKCKKLPN